LIRATEGTIPTLEAAFFVELGDFFRATI